MGNLSAEEAKRKNIIDMALGFTAMMRIFSKGSGLKIEAQLEKVFANLSMIRTRDEYQALHRSFCTWFVQEIWTAEKTLKDGKCQPSQPASYGHGAKILDIGVKVYVYYSGLPTVEIAQRVVPFLNGAVDVPIMEELKKSEYSTTNIRATKIKEIDEGTYEALQAIVSAESRRRGLYPVQYDDIMWRTLNRIGPAEQEPATGV